MREREEQAARMGQGRLSTDSVSLLAMGPAAQREPHYFVSPLLRNGPVFLLR